MENTIKERVKVFCLYKNIPVSKFESECGLSNAYISSMRKGFGSDKLNNVLKRFPELNRDWLLYGEGEMLKGQPITAINNGTNNGNIIGYNKGGVSNNGNDVEEVDAKVIPYVDTALARKRNFNIAKAINNNSELLKQKTINELFSPISFMQKMVDDSMSTIIQQGDIVFVKFLPQEANIISGKIYLIDTNTYGILVRQVYVNGNSFTLHAVNPAYEDIEVSRDDIFNFCRVVHSLRSHFNIQDEIITKVVQEQAKQISKLTAMLEKANERNEKLMELILNKL